MLKASILAVVCFLFFLAAHAVLFHFARPKEKARTLIRIFVFFLVLYPALTGLTGGGPFSWRGPIRPSPGGWETDWIDFVAGLFFYVFLFVGYLEFYFTADRSITCRMLMLIEDAPDKKLTPAEIGRLYDLDSVLTRRLRDMVYGGYLEEQEGRFRATAKGRRVERIYRFVIQWLNLGKY